jgi:sulfite reductase (ferredoxin)
VAELAPVFTRFKAERLDGESFGEYCARVGVKELGGTVQSVENPA